MKKNLFFSLLVLLVLTGMYSCVKEDSPKKASFTAEANNPKDTNKDSTALDPDLSYGSVSDIDGNIYRTVQIGNQTWIAENLKTTTFNDGSKIPLGYGAPAGYTDWFDYGNADYHWFNGAYCWYDNEIRYKNIYGALYNWHAAGHGNLCPTGWHVPTNSEWITLMTFLGGVVEPFNEITENAMVYCSDDNINKSGFAPVRAGELDGWGFIENGGFWWSATPRLTERDVPYAYLFNFTIMSYEPKSYGYSVRCLKD
jgi:uncharacterized protein (TIGR02145 family)